MIFPPNHGSNFQSIASLSVALNVGLSALFAFSENKLPYYIEAVDRVELFLTSIDLTNINRDISLRMVDVVERSLSLRRRLKNHHALVVKGSMLIKCICAVCAVVGMAGLIEVTIHPEGIDDFWQSLIIISCFPVILLSILYTFNSILVNIAYDKHVSEIEKAVAEIASAVRSRNLYHRAEEV